VSRREPSDEVKRNRRKALDAGMAAYGEAAADGDEDGAARHLDTLKVLKLLVPDEFGRLQPGPDVAD
jgi:hypothetical protein